MVYKPSIPAANDRTAQSFLDIRENFRKVNSAWDVDHASLLETTEKDGLHKKLTFPEQGSDPATGSNEAAIYSKSGINSDIYYRQESNGAVGKLYSDNHMSQGITDGTVGGLKMEAWATFSTLDGTFLQVNKKEKNAEGEIHIVKQDVKSPNVSSVTVSANLDTWTVNIDSIRALSTADYFYDIQYFQRQEGFAGAYPIITAKNSGTYSDVCTTTKLVLECRDSRKSPSALLNGYQFISFIQVAIWTVS